MKKQITLAIALFASATAGFAQSSSANIIISGSVSPLAAITATAAPALTDTELTSGVIDKQMSVVNEKSNRNVGYTVALKSANAAAASSSQARMNPITVGNPDLINYSIKYNGVAVTLDIAGQATVTNDAVKTPSAGINKNLTITIGAGFPAADTYSDTITLTLTNN
jgi:spore coat protein U-like protein